MLSKSGKIFGFAWLLNLFIFHSAGFYAYRAQNPAVPPAPTKTVSTNLNAPLKKCIEYAFNTEEYGSLSFASDNADEIVLSSTRNQLILFSTTNFKPVWTTDFGGLIVSDIILDGKSIYLANGIITDGSPENHALKSFDRTTGLLNWQTVLSADHENAWQTVNLNAVGEKIILLENGSKTARISVLSKTDGALIRSRETARYSRVAFYDGEYVSIATADKTILFLSPDGAVVGQIPVKETISALAFTPNKRFVYGDGKGNVYGSSLPGSVLRGWKFRAGAEITDITRTAYGLLVSSKDNFLYLLDPDRGKLIWKRRTAGRISGKPFVSESFAVIGGLFQPEIDIIDIKSGYIINRLLLEPDNYLNGPVFLQNKFLVISTVKGLQGFSNGDCRAD